jgi:hypothetical protein
LRPFGGTVAGWTRVQAHGASIELASSERPAEPAASGAKEELAAVEAEPGLITVERVPSTPRSPSSALSLDVLLSPGGVPVDEPTVHVHELWAPDGAPLPANALQIDLVPTHHAPGYSSIDAEVSFAYVVMHGRNAAGGSASCKTARARSTLVDKDAVRPALWDLGVSTLNSPRTSWLALSSPSAGVIRAVFESPEAATSFANWIRASGSVRVGPYRLGLFEHSGRKGLRPVVPVDLSATETFRPLTREDASGLRVGPLGQG